MARCVGGWQEGRVLRFSGGGGGGGGSNIVRGGRWWWRRCWWLCCILVVVARATNGRRNAQRTLRLAHARAGGGGVVRVYRLCCKRQEEAEEVKQDKRRSRRTRTRRRRRLLMEQYTACFAFHWGSGDQRDVGYCFTGTAKKYGWKSALLIADSPFAACTLFPRLRRRGGPKAGACLAYWKTPTSWARSTSAGCAGSNERRSQ